MFAKVVMTMSDEITLSRRTYRFTVTSARDEQNRAKLEALPSLNPDPLGGCEDHGHITASALVVNDARDHVLLTLHAKLGMWLPPGGHCDSDPDVVRVCRKEVYEETGHADLVALNDGILDVDIHTIPAGKTSRAHLHYDVRFAFVADMSRELVISSESKDLRWIPISEIGAYTKMPSVLVLTEKLRTL